MRIYFDVETIPSLASDARELVRETIKPPGTLKKPESIAAWWETDAPAAIEEAYRKQALDAAMGELVAIGYATDEAEPVSLVRVHGESEAELLSRFYAAIQSLLDANGHTGGNGHTWPDEPFFIAHNAPFDLGFLWRRSLVRGVRPPFKLPTPSARSGKDFGDTMELWAGYRGTIGLSRLCRALGLPDPKAEGDGASVFDWWQAGEFERIATYNRADVAAARACWWRLNWEATA